MSVIVSQIVFFQMTTIIRHTSDIEVHKRGNLYENASSVGSMPVLVSLGVTRFRKTFAFDNDVFVKGGPYL